MSVNDHHAIPRSRFGSNNGSNKRPVGQRRHDAYHVLVGNATPVEALREIVKMNIGAFKEEFLEDLLILLECENPYKCNVVKDKKKLKESEHQTGIARFPRLYTEDS